MRSVRTMIAAGAVALAATVGLSLPAQAATFSTGHIDILDVDYTGSGSPTLNIKQYSPADDDVNPVGSVIQVPAAAQATLGSGLTCVGAATDTVYRLPQSLNSSLLYAGWNTEGSTSAVTLQLVSASTPSGGRFAVYQAVTGGVSIKLASSATTCGTSSFSIPANQHAHANWVFTQAGTYTLVFRATVGTATSGNIAYTFSVG
ncbi:choice-of-anchor M domain-containing protein [Kineosporia sp. J2-2]|uniref:Choice-of-anchor M domain-containing protein n=1 Tax=Kineosporia corallincola TaxID=2835133 RepID=A0ABS5TTC0_9ACTN|nr:choice-of-anchor M domain-containing protein [Kineosporia corallincola]MBT0774036.1 choice-of-anchor M domain-containing protein [Kineosporia corallincola]